MTEPHPRRRTLLRWVWRGILLVVLLFAIEFVLIPQFVAARGALDSLGHISIWLLALGLGLELASIACYSVLTRSTLAVESRPSYPTLLRIDLAAQGVNNTVPGGGPTATAVKFRMLTLAGTRAANAATGTIIEISTSVLALGGLFGLAYAVSAGSTPTNPEYVIAAIVIGGVAVLALVAVVLLGRFREPSLRIASRVARRIPYLSESVAVTFLSAAADHVRDYRRSCGTMVLAVSWAILNWLLDAGALWVFLLAFGFHGSPTRLLIAYGLAAIIGLLPITPGGLGIIEGVLVPALVGFGTPQGIAALGVISWRLVQFWLPLPLSIVAYVSLRMGPLRRTPRKVRGDSLVEVG